MASRNASTMIKQGFISDPSFSFSTSRTTSLPKLSSPSASPPPTANESTRSTHSNPTLFEMMSEEHNRDPHILEDTRKRSHARVEKILTEFRNGVVYAYGLGAGDVRLTVVSRDGYRVAMDVHRRVLSEKSRFFMEKMNQKREKGVSHMVEISECDDVDVYVEIVVLMYCDDLKKRLIGGNVNKILALLKVSAAIMFDDGIMSCLEYLEAVPWSEDEEEMIISCIGELDLPDSLLTPVRQRVSSSQLSTSSRSDDIFLKLLTGVTQAKDEKARQRMKTLIFRLLREEETHFDVSKGTLYSLCHRCLSSLVLCVSEAVSQMNQPGKDRGALMGEISRDADNLLWIVDILIQKKSCDEFVKIWADQKDLANLHSNIPTIYRHKISRITAQICVGIGKGRILVNRETRFLVLNTWLEALYEDFGWMRRAASWRSLNRELMEEGLSQMILTLSLREQEAILMKWFDRFTNKGDDCPNVQRAFEVWWRRRRTFVRQVAGEAEESRLEITMCDYTAQ